MPREQDPRVTEAILDAAAALLTERSFGDLSMEAIAARAGVGKPAIYRRYAGKADVVVAAIRRALPPMEPPAAQEGGLRGRLRALVDQAVPHDPPGYAALIGGLMAEHRRHPELIGAFREQVLLPRRAAVRAVIEEGRRDGVLRADLDTELAVDLIGGPFLARAFAGLDMDQGWRERLLDGWWAMASA